ncbi:lipocalin-like domain-containing protein [Maribacter algarum]|uniref:Lipocalin-like domain-containing protein n=1 Tax=Maribacter algarum (ex Zhang et al. 2020) TaxID=2578118 RepID=A0A5S3PJ40_9FLAO|nr:lipocalin-like domain-containing protein [Maribacter algarum]TMM53359.1 lipocalin-like domain-containing protein [Maribacter algarum]
MKLLKIFSSKWVLVFSLTTLILFFHSCSSKGHTKNTLEGSWNLTEVRWVSVDTTFYLKKPQLGLFLITPERYSIIWSPTEEKRKPFYNLSNPTDEEIKSGFRSIVFNSGSYSQTDSILVTTANLAKVPGFAGGKQFYTYSLSENQLSLMMYDETYPNGEKPKWSGVWKTNFLFEKIESQ